MDPMIKAGELVIVQQERENMAQSLKCKRSAAPLQLLLQMRGIGLCAIVSLCKQADDKADAVLLDIYGELS